MNPGPTTIGQLGLGGYKASANPLGYQAPVIGVTIDWSLVNPVAGRNATGTVTVNATGGTFTISYGGQTTGAIAYNAAPDVVETAVEALSTVGNGNVRIGGAASAYTYEFVGDKQKTPITAVTTGVGSLTGGAGTAAVAVTQTGLADAALSLPGGVTVPVGEKTIPAGTVIYKVGGKYAPAATATTLVRGECYVVDRHLFYSSDVEQVGDVFDVGTAILSRLLIDGSGQPTKANFLAAFPGVRLVTG